MIKIFILFFACLSMLTSLSHANTATADKVAVSKEKIADWIQTEWKVPTSIFDQTEAMVKKEFSEEEDSVKTTIKILDLAVHQFQQKAGKEVKNMGTQDLQSLISEIITKYKAGTGWGEMAKQTGISGGASELNYRASEIQHGEIPGPKPKEETPSEPALSEDQIIEHLNQEFGIPVEVYEKVKSGIPADESSNTLKILVLAIYEVDFSGKEGKSTQEQRSKKILASATRFTELHYKENEGWGDLSLKAGFPTGGDVHRIKAEIEKGEPVQWPTNNK